MNVLELFAGSRSIGKIAEERGHQVFSVDINNFENIDLVKNILQVQKKDILFDPDLIWASPPCTCFSVASIGYHWNKDNTPKTKQAVKGIEILNKTLEIISWYPKAIFYIENPRGKMRKIINNIDRKTVTYCSYGDTRMKPTDIWSNNFYNVFNLKGFKPKEICFNSNPNCNHEKAPRGTKRGTQGIKGNYNRSKIPNMLCLEIIKSVENCL